MPTHSFPTMGTMASLIFVQVLPEAHVLDAVEALFSADDQRFSLYRDDSEISRLARHETTLTEGSETLGDAYRDAILWRTRTNGAFTPERPDGVLDLSGIVKARSIEQARIVFETHGISDGIIDVGGDAVALGARRGTAWRAGVIDPDNRSVLLCSVPLTPDRPAIATSGVTERGEHIWGTGPAPFVQVTVLARDIVTADVLATAILAGDADQRDDLCERFDIDVLTVERDGSLSMTPGMKLAAGVTAASAR